MRIAIVSRIYEPEPSAASFRLAALARACARAGHDVTVLTVRPPRALAESGRRGDRDRPERVRRAPVLRDGSGYVRGYLPYLSFDVPLFLRILFGRRRDLIVVEPPPTTGFFVRAAAALRRTPYAYYAADIWADASAQTGAPGWMVRLVRRIERVALRGARVVLSVSDGVTRRLDELGDGGRVETIGNGIDVAAFRAGLDAARDGGPAEPPEFVYAGTASEWHGAVVFVEALPEVLRSRPDARLRFIGGGSERAAIEQRARELGVAHAVSCEPVMAPGRIAPILHGAAAALASVRAGSGYDFAFPTKLYSAAACGAPLIYAGVGPAVAFVGTEVDGSPLGSAVPLDAAAVAGAMRAALAAPVPESRRARVAAWAAETVGIDRVAERARAALERLSPR